MGAEYIGRLFHSQLRSEKCELMEIYICKLLSKATFQGFCFEESDFFFKVGGEGLKIEQYGAESFPLDINCKNVFGKKPWRIVCYAISEREKKKAFKQISVFLMAHIAVYIIKT